MIDSALAPHAHSYDAPPALMRWPGVSIVNGENAGRVVAKLAYDTSNIDVEIDSVVVVVDVLSDDGVLMHCTDGFQEFSMPARHVDVVGRSSMSGLATCRIPSWLAVQRGLV